MRLLLITVVLVISSLLSNAQNKLRFSSHNYLGITEGESGTGLQLQTINGLKYKTWFAGLGTGLDYYYQRSVPVFFSAAKFLNSKRVPLYFTGDIGVNIPWIKEYIYIMEGPGKFNSGLYWAGGVGYRFGFKNNNALLLNMGYNYKRLTETYERTVQCFVPPCPTFTEKYDYRLKRLSVRVGWMF